MIGKSGQRESSLHIALEYLGLGNYTFTIFASEISFFQIVTWATVQVDWKYFWS